MKARKFLVPLIFGLGMALVWCLANQPVMAAKHPHTIAVNTFADEYNTGSACSLREAIQAVNTGADFGGCIYDGSETINLSTGTYTLGLPGDFENDNETGDLDIQAAVTIQGNGAEQTHVNGFNLDRVFDVQSAGGPVMIDGISISDGERPMGVECGGGIAIDESTVILSNLIIYDNIAFGGGGVCASGGAVTVTNTTIAANTGGLGGGGIYVANNCQLVLSDILIAENEADSGGGLWVNTGSAVTLSAATIEDNLIDDYGGGIYLSEATARLASGEISANGDEGAFGGGVYVDNSVFYLEGGDIIENIGDSGGGGIFVNNGQVVMSGGTIMNNTSYWGGGVFVDNGGDFTMQAGQIVSNTFTMTGGGVYLRGNSSTFTLMDDALVAFNSAPENGGGIHVQSGTLFAEGGEVRDNYAANSGGGIFLNDGQAYFNNTIIHGNEAMQGGGIAFIEGTASLTNTQIISNTGFNGGGVYMGNDESTAITLTAVVIAENAATSGGGIYAATGNLFLRQTRILENSATNYGGGIRLGTSINNSNPPEPGLATLAPGFRMLGGLVSGNTSNDGGGVFQEGFNNVLFEGVAIVGNFATSVGGGISSQDPINLKNVTISHNHASQGGGIYHSIDAMDIEYSTIANNTSTAVGGIYSSGGMLHIRKSIVADNATANCSAGVISDGFNLDSGDSCDFEQPGDQQNINPVLGPLANNGGDTQTHALLHGSPAIDASPCHPNTRVDQRGRPRPNLGSSFCDIGSFEANIGGLADLSLAKTVNPASAAPGEVITYTLAYTNTGPSGAVQVSIEDFIPAGASVVSITSTGATITPLPGKFYVWMVDDLAPRSGGMITLTAELDTPLASDWITNTATITSSAVDADPADNASVALLTVSPVAPAAANDSYTTAEETALNVAPPGVLGNDTDENGDSLTAVLEASPLHGSLTLNEDGSFSYTPGPDYVGADTFTYHAHDGTLNSNVATVTIHVGSANDPPVAAADSYATDEDTPLEVVMPGVLGNDTDPDGDTLMAVLDTGPAHGILTLYPNGAFNYTPSTDYAGEDSFLYHASDGSLDSPPVTVTLQIAMVNDVPQARDDSYTTDDDTSLVVIAPGVLLNDSDPENDGLVAVLYTSTGFGDLVLYETGSFSYTPDPGYIGDDTFSYRASDGSLESPAATVTIHVGVANEAPLAVTDSYTISQDSELDIAAPGLLANDSDPNGDTLMAVLDTGPVNGSLDLHADGSFRYIPTAGYVGSDSFTYHASDGSLSSETVTVEIIVETGQPPEFTIYLPLVSNN